MSNNVIRKGYADCSAGQIHYRALAGDPQKTPIVWLHQTASSSAMCAEDDVLWPYFERAQGLRPEAVAATIKGKNFEPDLDPDGVADNVRKFLAALD